MLTLNYVYTRVINHYSTLYTIDGKNLNNIYGLICICKCGIVELLFLVVVTFEWQKTTENNLEKKIILSLRKIIIILYTVWTMWKV